MKKIKRALISVSKKTELNKILKTLKKYKIEIISSGGTYKVIRKLGFKSINEGLIFGCLKCYFLV